MINYNGAMIPFYIIIGGLYIGWSVEYFYNKKYIRGGVFMMCAIGCVAYLMNEICIR